MASNVLPTMADLVKAATKSNTTLTVMVGGNELKVKVKGAHTASTLAALGEHIVKSTASFKEDAEIGGAIVEHNRNHTVKGEMFLPFVEAAIAEKNA